LSLELAVPWESSHLQLQGGIRLNDPEKLGQTESLWPGREIHSLATPMMKNEGFLKFIDLPSAYQRLSISRQSFLCCYVPKTKKRLELCGQLLKT